MAGRLLYMITLLIISLEGAQQHESRYIMRQRLEDSCGFAVTASLLSCYWLDPVSEGFLITRHLEQASDSSTAARNISFSSMRDILSAYGIASLGFHVDIDDLAELTRSYVPVICLDSGGAGHFYLLLGVTEQEGNEVFIIADPDWGIAYLSRESFAAVYSQRVLVSASAYKAPQTAHIEELKEFADAFALFHARWVHSSRL